MMDRNCLIIFLLVATASLVLAQNDTDCPTSGTPEYMCPVDDGSMDNGTTTSGNCTDSMDCSMPEAVCCTLDCGQMCYTEMIDPTMESPMNETDRRPRSRLSSGALISIIIATIVIIAVVIALIILCIRCAQTGPTGAKGVMVARPMVVQPMGQPTVGVQPMGQVAAVGMPRVVKMSNVIVKEIPCYN